MKIEELKNSILIWGALSEGGLSYLKDRTRDNDLKVLVPENRPSMIGLKHNIPLLKKEGIPFIDCTDNMLGFLFYKKKIKETVLFGKKKEESHILAISGSLFAVYLTKLHGVPLKVLIQGKVSCNYLDRDASTLGGKKFILSKEKPFVQEASDELIDPDKDLNLTVKS